MSTWGDFWGEFLSPNEGETTTEASLLDQTLQRHANGNNGSIGTMVTDLLTNVTANMSADLIGSTESSLWISTTGMPVIIPIKTCAKEEFAEPEFQRQACEGNLITAWIAATFLISMILFGVIKCLITHGPRAIFDLRMAGVSFPKRPEFFVLLGSSLPLVFTVLTRPLFEPLTLGYDIFIRGWGLAQTRYFLDLFVRTASVYHMVCWTYRSPIIHLLWHIKLTGDYCHNRWKNRPVKPTRQTNDKTRRTLLNMMQSPSSTNLAGKSGRRTGRTTEHGYGNKKRARSKSVRGTRSQDNKAGSTTSGNTDSQPVGQQHELLQLQTQVINTGGISVIAPQRLYNNSPTNPMLNPYATGMSMGMYPSMNGSFPTDMGYYGAGMGPNMNLATDANLDPTAQAGLMKSVKITTKPPDPPRPPPTRAFSIACKRILPAFIYLFSFCTTVPSVLAFEVEPDEESFVAARCTSMCRSYFYYDLIVLVILPTCMIIVAFFHGALARKQMNGGSKMPYRLRCYYVTFILLNVPMLVIMITSIAFQPSSGQYRSIFATGILIATTAYHANFALKSTVYTTACNCICCTQACLQRTPMLDRCITYFTTPVVFKDKEAQMEGTVIPVYADTAPTEKRK